MSNKMNGDYHHDINVMLERQEYDADTINSQKSVIAVRDARIAELEAYRKRVHRTFCTWNGGLTPAATNGLVIIKASDYNNLVEALNNSKD